MDSQFKNLNKKTKKKVIEQKENFIVRNGEIYDLEGENISHLYSLELNPKYISDKKIIEYKSKLYLGDHEKENGGFIFMFYQVLQNIQEKYPNLNQSEIARLLYLSTYISYEENKIQHDNGLMIEDSNLMEMLKLNRQRYNAFMNKLVDEKLLYIDSDNNKYLSYSVCKYGELDKRQLQHDSTSYVRMFKKTVRNVFDNAKTTYIKKLSSIYMILPYLNLVSNIVSHNPNEMNVDKIKPMTMLELSNTLGYSNYDKLKKMLYSIKVNGQHVFGFFMHENDRRTMKIVVNPSVVFAGNAEQLKAIKALFSK